MRQALAPLLFDDDDPAAAEAARRSVVAPAHRSPQEQRRAITKLTADNLPLHSFHTLLSDHPGQEPYPAQHQGPATL